jgi:iron complex transport system ATP-binding protein
VGRVRILGHELGAISVHDLRRQVKLVSGVQPRAVDAQLTTRQSILTGVFGTLELFHAPERMHYDRADDLMQKVGLSNLADAKVATLSSGERLRCAMARALVVPPKLLILDEPTAGLDLLGREHALLAIDQLSKQSLAPSVLMITHHFEELPSTTRWAWLLRAGRVVSAGPMGEVLTDKHVSAAYDAPVRLFCSDGRWHARLEAQAEPE